MAIEDKPIPHGLPSLSKLKTGTSLEKLREIMERVDEKKRPDFEKEVTSDEYTTEKADKIFSDYGKEAFHVLLIRLSPNALLSLLEKVSVAVLKDIFKGTENEIKLFERKMAILVLKGNEKKNIKSWKDRFEVLRNRAMEEPVDLDIEGQDLESFKKKPKIQRTPEKVVSPGTNKSEFVPLEAIHPDEEKEAKFKILAKISVSVRSIEESGYSVIPIALENEKKNLPFLKIHDLEGVSFDLEVLKTIIKNAKAETVHRIEKGETFETGSPIISETVTLGGYRLVPNKKNVDKSIPDLEIPQDVEIEINFGIFLKDREKYLTKHPELLKELFAKYPESEFIKKIFVKHPEILDKFFEVK